MAEIFQIEFSELSEAQCLALIHERIRTRLPCYIVTPNLHFARVAENDADFLSALKAAELRLCDSAVLFRMLRLQGTPLPARLVGADLTPKLFRLAEENCLRVFLFGSDQPTLERVRKKFPKVVCGVACPPVHEALWELDELNEGFLRQIQALKPDIMFVALGVRKQEFWARKYFEASGVPVTLCIGASLDFIGGRILRSPKIFSWLGFEWLWRLGVEPRRLWRRYSGDAFFLVAAILKMSVKSLRRTSSFRRRDAALVEEEEIGGGEP